MCKIDIFIMFMEKKQNKRQKKEMNATSEDWGVGHFVAPSLKAEKFTTLSLIFQLKAINPKFFQL